MLAVLVVDNVTEDGQSEKDFLLSLLRKGTVRQLIVVITQIDETYSKILKDAEGNDEDPESIAQCIARERTLITTAIADTETPYGELVGRFGAVVADVVVEVTDDKSLPKEERKRLQIVHAHMKSPQAAMVKIADKICNLRDIASVPPAGWADERKREYFDWAKSVVDGLPVVNQGLLDLFGRAYAMGHSQEQGK